MEGAEKEREKHQSVASQLLPYQPRIEFATKVHALGLRIEATIEATTPQSAE